VGTYLITGGAGFIGSHLAERLLRDGHRVLVLDDLSTGSLENIAECRSHSLFEFVEGTVLNAPLVSEMVAETDGVFHLAASVGVLQIMDHPAATITNNVLGTETVLAAAAKAEPKPKVVVTSSSEVYGKTTSVPFQEEGSIVLGATQNIRWGYAASKLVDEFLGLSYFVEFGVPAIIVRPFNTIGPRQSGVYGMVVPRLLQQAIRGEDLTVHGDGRQTRCFTFVSDVVEWLVRLIERESAVGEVFNLGNPQEVSIGELAERIIAVAGSSASIRYVPYERAYPRGFEDMQRRVPSIEKVIAVTGHSPAVPLEDALRRTHDWLTQRASGTVASAALAGGVNAS
jgi:UDP-glucose 4-epimerase